MIYTVTFNPSIDYIIHVNDLQLGKVNRTTAEEILPGGKGINVSIVLNNLGHKSVALGFVSGFTGVEIENKVKEHGCTPEFIQLDNGFSRINVKINSNEESEINGQGPKISQAHIDELYAKLDKLQEGDILVLAGSIPNTLPEDVYEIIMARLQDKKIQVVVDATNNLLKNVLKYHPFLIKPNNHELGEMFGVTLKTKDEIIFYAKKLQELGARNVLISMAGEGALFVAEDQTVYQSEAPKGKLVNSVGAGDSMVAGFITGYMETHDFKEAFLMGVATGSASAFSPKLATRPEVMALRETLGQ